MDGIIVVFIGLGVALLVAIIALIVLPFSPGNGMRLGASDTWVS